MARGLGIGQCDGKDGVHRSGERIDGVFPVFLESDKGYVEALNPFFRMGGAGEEYQSFAQFLGKKVRRGKEFPGILGVFCTYNDELVFFQRIIL